MKGLVEPQNFFPSIARDFDNCPSFDVSRSCLIRSWTTCSKNFDAIHSSCLRIIVSGNSLQKICADYFMIRLQNYTYTTVKKRLYKLNEYCTRTKVWLSGGLRQIGAFATNVERWGKSLLHVVRASLLDGSSVLQFGAKFIVAIDWLDSESRINQLLGLTHWQSES